MLFQKVVENRDNDKLYGRYHISTIQITISWTVHCIHLPDLCGLLFNPKSVGIVF